MRHYRISHLLDICMTDICLTVDVARSHTEIIYITADQTKPSYLMLPPAIEEITQDKLNWYLESFGYQGSASPEAQLWVEWNNKVVVLGDFAFHFDALDCIGELKYENALWKVLAAIGLIVELNSVEVTEKKQIDLELVLLLSWHEYSDRRSLEQQLKLMLADFQVRQLSLKVNLEHFLVMLHD